jgi:hypothetical protein
MWRIDRDYINDDGIVPSRVGTQEEHSRIPVIAWVAGMQSERLPETGADGQPLPLVRFRLLDDDEQVYYDGELHDDGEGLNQLAALRYGEGDAGCTIVEVKRDGQWVREVG